MISSWRALLLISVFISVSVHAKPLASVLNPILAKQSATSTNSMLVMDASTGKTLFDYHARQVLNPASNVKLFSAAAALYGLGVDYSFKTTIKGQMDEGNAHNLVFEFSGDPSLTSADVRDLIHQLAQNNVHAISGDIFIDDSRFAAPDYSPGTSYEDLSYYYAAPVNSVIVDGNAVELTLIPNKVLGKPIQVVVADDQSWVRVRSTVRTVDEKELASCDLQALVEKDNQIQLSGCIAQTPEPRHERIAVANPKARMFALIKEQLQAEGVAFTGKMRSNILPNTRILATHQSRPMPELVTHMLKDSDNLYADALLKTLGAEKGAGNYLGGVAALKDILGQHTHLNFADLQISDGAGTRFNLIAPYSIAQLLFALYHDEQMQPYFMAALPVAGVDGSLKNRFKNSEIKDHLFAKTGSMHDVSSLSGYIITKKKHTLIFSIISNNVLGGVRKTKQLEEALCEAIYLAG